MLAVFSWTCCNSQNANVAMKIEYGSGSQDLQRILRFEGIGLTSLILSGEKLTGKDYELSIKEYVDGKLVKTDKLFDSSEDNYFKIKSDKLHFYAVSKLTDNDEFKLQFQFDGFSTRQYSFPLLKAHSIYAVKDFLGPKGELEVPVNKEFNMFALLTPTRHADGSSSYCEVAQSGIKAEELGNHYKLPHYFLIVMQIK